MFVRFLFALVIDIPSTLWCACLRSIVKPFGIAIELSPVVSDGCKTAETIESVSQLGSPYAELPNYADNQRVLAEMSMLDEVAAEAARLEPAGLDEVDSIEVDTTEVAGHCAQRLAVACEDGPEGRPIRIGDRENNF